MALKLGPSTRDLHLEDDLITHFPSSAFVGLTKFWKKSVDKTAKEHPLISFPY